MYTKASMQNDQSWSAAMGHRGLAVILLLFLLEGLGMDSSDAAELYLAPPDRGGSDANPGTKDKPFATLERARDEVRTLKKKGLPKGGVIVWLHEGTYELARTFALGREDSGTAEEPIVYRALPGAQARLCGGRPLPASAFRPVTDEVVLARMDAAAREKVLAADLKALGIAEFGKMEVRGFGHGLVPSGLELFFNDRPMQLARWPDTGFAMTGKIADSGVRMLAAGDPSKPDDPAQGRGTFAFPDERIKRWATAEDLWVYGYWCWDWADEYLPVHSVDAGKREITLARAHNYGLKEGKRFYVLNLLEELDRPGEWYLDRKSGRLYFWPPEPLEKAHVVVSVLAAPLVSLEGARHVTLRGLTLEAGRDCGVRILDGSDNLVAGCTVRNMGTVGVHIGDGFQYGNTVHETRGGERNGVQSCEIYGTGEGAIILAGGDRKTLAPCGNFALNNDLHDFGRVARTYHVGVDLAGVGCRVAHNHIHHAPHIGVFFWGNDHMLEFNDVHDLCQETADAGAFYIGRDWSMRGNVLRHNFVHDIGRFAAAKHFGGTMAFYLDDFASGTTVYGNVISRVYIGVMIGGGHDNIVAGNVWADCAHAAVHVDARGRGWAKSYFDGREKILTQRIEAVKFRQPPYNQRYPALVRVLEGDPAMPKGNRIADNLCAGGRWLEFLDGMNAQNAGVGENLVLKTAAEAGFVAPEKGDFRLKPDAPVFKTLPGFKPIPFEKIGLQPDEYRTELLERAVEKR